MLALADPASDCVGNRLRPTGLAQSILNISTFSLPTPGMTAAHPFGADNLGRDTLARVIFGGRVSLAIGVVAMLISMSIGTLVGLLAGYFSRSTTF